MHGPLPLVGPNAMLTSPRLFSRLSFAGTTMAAPRHLVTWLDIHHPTRKDLTFSIWQPERKSP
jgi:hypothetical protein